MFLKAILISFNRRPVSKAIRKETRRQSFSRAGHFALLARLLGKGYKSSRRDGKWACLSVSLLLLLFSIAFLPATADESDALLVARYDMNPASNDPHKLTDSGPFHYNGVLNGDVTFVPGHQGQALHFSGDGSSFVRIANAPEINRLINLHFTVTAWVEPDSAPPAGSNPNSYAGLISTHQKYSDSIALGINAQSQLVFHGDDGRGLSPSARVGQLKPGEWRHVAVTYDAGGDRVIYLDGVAVDTRHVPLPINASTDGLWFGQEAKIGFHGALGQVSFYADALTPDQVKADMDGTLQPTPATSADIAVPMEGVRLYLTRFDQPLGLKTDYAPTRHSVLRVPGPNAVDWPTITIDGKPVFTKDSVEDIFLPLRGGAALADPAGNKFNSILKVDGDTPVMPGNHWVRAVAWRWNRKDIYTVDPTARGSNDITPPDYELFGFPIVIKGAGNGKIQSITLTSEGQTVYQRQEALDSLTLVLPAAKYELQVNGAAAQSFETGLEPIVIGHPRDVMRKVNLSFADGTTVSMPSAAETFTEQKDWDADVALMAAPATADANPNSTINRPGPVPFADIPVSPIQIHGIAMSHGMSGGWFHEGQQGPAFTGDVDAYASHLADLGYDQVIHGVGSGWENSKGLPTEQLLNALAQHGIKAGIYPSTLGDSNLPIYFYCLADYHAPKIRDIQLVTQRFASYPNFLGIYFGGDNGAYARYWDWSPPKTRWAEAFENLISGARTVPRGPEIQYPMQPFERVDTESNFLDYVAKYDQTWGTYGQLAHAVTDILPQAIVTTGSFGSSPGVLGHGGWAIGTVPGKLIFDGMPVQMAYDWNENNTSEPMHLVALLDRLKSDHPEKATWAQVDDFGLLFGREGRQRAYALALTRGVTSIGSNFLANGQSFSKIIPDPAAAENAAKVDDYRDLFKWIHTYGGAYAGTKPDAKIAILYVENQAISRGVNNPPDKGSQEGKTTEALFLCHAAGWPAKIVTPDELRAGLDPGISALLLVGLNKIDDTWNWSQGLEGALQKFTSRGGKILVDDESFSPLPAVETGMQVMAYLTELSSPPGVSPSIQLFERNKENIGLLQKAMANTPPPVAASSSPTIWAVPHTTGDVQYVTVVNWGYQPGTNADKDVMPQTGTLAWHTDRPIYDVRAGRLLTAEEATHVDLTKNGFCLYALPPKPVAKPSLALNGETATVDVGGVHGVPVRIDVHANDKTYTVFAASGTPAKLPLQANQENQVQATELLSGQTSETMKADATSLPATSSPAADQSIQVAQFLSRKDVPVVVALTSEQAADPKMTALADRVVKLLKSHDRDARVGRADPTDVVQSIQVAQSINKYPKWQTADVDLVLFGSPANNVLLFDQVRGCLLPAQPAEGRILLTYSPFVGGCDALNVLGTNADTLAASIDKLSQ
jgi:hypothetical protein